MEANLDNRVLDAEKPGDARFKHVRSFVEKSKERDCQKISH